MVLIQGWGYKGKNCCRNDSYDHDLQRFELATTVLFNDKNFKIFDIFEAFAFRGPSLSCILTAEGRSKLSRAKQ